MKRSKFLPYILFSLLSGFSGAVIWKQFELFHYFYNSKVDDFLLIIIITLTSGLLAFKYVSLKKPALLTIQGITIIIGVIISKLNYAMFQYYDMLSLSTYLFGILAAISIISPIKKSTPSNHLFIILASSIAGGLLQFFIQNSALIWILSMLYIILNFRNARLQSEGSLQSIYALQFFLLLALIPIISPSIHFYESQKSYYDKVIYSKETPFQRVDITEWKGQRWYYYNGINNFSTIDEWLFYEPLVHPVMEIAKEVKNVLVIGGDNGLAIRELLKHDKIMRIEHLLMDTALYELAKSHELFTSINKGSLINHKVHSEQRNTFRYLNNNLSNYDIIILDVPDPIDLELNQYYTSEFYELCYNALSNNGVIITQAGSPYFATQAYYCISNTIEAAQFSVLEMHNQVLTMGEWGWIIGVKNLDSEQLVAKAKALDFNHLETTWLNNEAMNMMLSFGKTSLVINDTIVNSLKNPLVHSYYTNGTWDFN